MAANPEGAHVGGSLSAADILTVLYCRVLRPGRDHFVLSKGHAAAGLYAALAECGILPESDLAGYARNGGRLGGHPTKGLPGVEFPTGSLGHGLSLGVGLALAARRGGLDERVFVLLGDGELQEGSVWEAAAAAGFLDLGNLIAVVDRNGLQINGSTERRTGTSADLATRWAGFGWDVVKVDGHDLAALAGILAGAGHSDRPTVLIARTIKGRGVSFLENRKKSHYAVLSSTLLARALAELGEPSDAGPLSVVRP